jgi:hypothetical protein
VIRVATSLDVPWLLSLAISCYPAFDEAAGRIWLAALVADPTTLAARGNHSAGFAQVFRLPWNPSEMVADLVHLYSEKSSMACLEPLSVLRFLDEKSVAIGCSKFYIASTIADLTPFAQRLGARPLGRVHVLEHEHV